LLVSVENPRIFIFRLPLCQTQILHLYHVMHYHRTIPMHVVTNRPVSFEKP